MRLTELPYLYFTVMNRAFIPVDYKIFVCSMRPVYMQCALSLVIDALLIVCNNQPCRGLIMADRSLICRRNSVTLED